MQDWIYLDYNASTPIAPEVLEAMAPFQAEQYGNASSLHRAGRLARQAIEQAREQVAAGVNAHPSQVIFTSGGTEANNLALTGIIHGPRQSLAVTGIEHESVLVPAHFLHSIGAELQTLAVNEQGVLDLGSLDEALRSSNRPQLVSVMLANNETGALQPVAEVVQRVRAQGGLVHTDAVQALGKNDTDFQALGVNLMTLSAHKVYGPKGAGALVVDKGLDLQPLLHGGSQEKGRRAGTENVAAIVGFGRAVELARQRQKADHSRQQELRDLLQKNVQEQISDIEVFANGVERIANTLFFAVAGIESQSLIMNLDESGFGVSAGSACGAHHDRPSHVLEAMGVSAEIARGAIRVSLGRETTPAHVEAFVANLKQQVKRLTSLASGW